MKKRLSRRVFIKTVGFASVAGAVGYCEAFAGTTQSQTLPEPVLAYRRVVKSKDIKTYSQAALNLRKWMMKNDPHYPIYHFTGPESWINDPNGPIYYKGKYHLFYQFDPQVDDGKGRWKRSKRTWGHAVSEDIVHWQDWPVAIWPDTKYDINGVYSGNTFIDGNGDLCGLYTGNVGGHKETYGMLVRSKDDGATWEKKMVMDDSQRPNPGSPVHWDGQVWKHNNLWYQLIGGRTGGEKPQGAAWLWQEPIGELEVLRGKHIHLPKPKQRNLDAVKGDALEISASVKLGTNGRLVLGVRTSDDGKSYTPVYLDAAKGIFGIGDRSQPIDLPTDDVTTLRVFIDRSIIEVYVNGYAITFVGYPDPDHQGLRIIKKNPALNIQSIDIWEMKSMWDK